MARIGRDMPVGAEFGRPGVGRAGVGARGPRRRRRGGDPVVAPGAAAQGSRRFNRPIPVPPTNSGLEGRQGRGAGTIAARPCVDERSPASDAGPMARIGRDMPVGAEFGRPGVGRAGVGARGPRRRRRGGMPRVAAGRAGRGRRRRAAGASTARRVPRARAPTGAAPAAAPPYWIFWIAARTSSSLKTTSSDAWITPALSTAKSHGSLGIPQAFVTSFAWS
jgi:hypothetical protein